MENKRALKVLHDAGVYLPAVVPGLGVGGFYVFSSLKVLGHGETIDAALEDARRRGNVPDAVRRPTFFAEGQDLLRHGEVVATANSRTLCQRIANALNLYNPNERGF